MEKLLALLHLRGICRFILLFMVNHLLAGTNPQYFEVKRKLLNTIGFSIGEGTKIVGPIDCTGTLVVGKNCWIGKNLVINGNGTVEIGDNCDIAPEVTFLTGGHEIGSAKRRAGKGLTTRQCIGNGVWIGGRATIVGNVEIRDGCVVAACSCVVKNVASNTLVGGVPAKIIRRLEDETFNNTEKEND